MGSRVGGVGATKSTGNGTDTSTTIAEIGQATPNGYARQSLSRAGGTWPSTLSTGSYQASAPQVTFTFTGTPTLNAATLWFLGLNTTVGADNCLFGADLAATRTFSNGDTEKITITYRQT